MVTIPNEPVGLFPTTWVTNSIDGATVKDLVTDTIAGLGSGEWSQVYDTSQSNHEYFSLDHRQRDFARDADGAYA